MGDAMWLDLAILALIAFLAGFGARSGAALAGLRLAALPLAYAGALGAAWAFGPALGRQLGWSETAGALAAGTAGLLGAQLLISLGTRALRRETSHPPASQALGAVFGALRGALFALPILWLAGLAEGARVSGVRPELPDLSGARLPALGGEVIGAGARQVVDTQTAGGRFALGMMSRPAETVEALQQLVQDPRVIALQRDGVFWQHVEQGAVGAALARPTARALVADRRFRAQAAEVGAVSREAGKDPRLFQAELALALSELGPRLRAVKDDPALSELLEDPEVRASLQRGNSLALLTDPRFRALVSRATR
jgi:hypothetical protein